jgi:copper transport protein
VSERGGGQRERRRIAQGLALLGTVLVLVLFGGVGGASAHAALTGSDPQDGSVLKTAPTEVTLTFSESIGLLDDSFRVLTPENRRVHTGDPGHAGDRSDTARVTLPKGLGTGTFTVAWRVVSADSHPISGAFTFSIGKPSATAPPVLVDPDGNTAAGTLYDAARYFAYGGLALLIGAATFVLVCGFPGPVRRLLLTGWWILAGSTVALLLLRGPYERGSGPADAFDPSVLSETLTSRPGLALLARLVLLGAAVFYPVREQARGRVVLALGGLLTVSLAVTWAVAEHASAGIQVPVAMVSSVLHLLSMAVWLGGLGALLTALYRSAEPLPAAVVNRFSRLALASVTVLVVTGVYQSWRGLGSWDALTSTSYGRLLLAKLVAVLVLLAGAGASRRWTGRLMLAAEEARTAAVVPVEERVPQTVGASAAPTDVRVGRADGPSDGGPSDGGPSDGGASDDGAPDPDHEPSDKASDKSLGKTSDKTSDKASDKASGTASDEADRYRRALRRSVLVEVVVGIVVLVITTLLTGTQPGRAATEAAAASATEAAGQATASTTTIPFDVGTKGGHGKVQIQLTPSRVGENSVQAVIYGPDGGFATVPELRLTFTLESQQIGPIDAELTDKGGYWAADGVTLPVAGTWTMKATVRTTDIDQVTVSKTVKIG